MNVFLTKLVFMVSILGGFEFLKLYPKKAQKTKYCDFPDIGAGFGIGTGTTTATCPLLVVQYYYNYPVNYDIAYFYLTLPQ